MPTLTRKSHVLDKKRPTVLSLITLLLIASWKVILTSLCLSPFGSGIREIFSVFIDKSTKGGFSGSMKYSNSAILNSLNLIIPCLGLISFLYPLPV